MRVRVLTLYSQTATSIKFPGYLEHTIWSFGKNGHMKNANYANIYIHIPIISEISIDMNRGISAPTSLAPPMLKHVLVYASYMVNSSKHFFFGLLSNSMKNW